MIAVVVVAGGMLAGCWFTSRLRRLPAAPPVPPAPSVDDRPPDDRPSVSIVVPARDEEATLPALLDSIATGAPGVHEVIVVDDDSSDATADVAVARGARVVQIDGPPAGWAGKPHACVRGAEAATGELLVFLDADVRLLPGALERLVAANREVGGLLSVQPYHRVERRYEELSAMFNVVAVVGSGAFARWPSPRRPVAFGPCLVTSAADYRRVGGHGAVRAEVVEDIALAREYARVGLPVNAFVGAGAVEFRMYPNGPGQLVEGWTKNIAGGAADTDRVGLVAGVSFVAGCAASAVLAVQVAASGSSVERADVAAAVGSWAAVTLVLHSVLRRLGSFRWSTSVLHPITTVAFLGLFARSAWSTVVRRQVTWRGRAVAVGRSRTD